MGVTNAHLCAATPNNDVYERRSIRLVQKNRREIRNEPPIIAGAITVPTSSVLASI